MKTIPDFCPSTAAIPFMQTCVGAGALAAAGCGVRPAAGLWCRTGPVCDNIPVCGAVDTLVFPGEDIVWPAPSSDPEALGGRGCGFSSSALPEPLRLDAEEAIRELAAALCFRHTAMIADAVPSVIPPAPPTPTFAPACVFWPRDCTRR